MPHIVLETTSDLVENAHVPEVLEALTAKLCSIESIQPSAVKAYHTLRSVWTVGEGHPAGFAHCTVSILAGRPLELRRKISDELYAELRRHFAQSLEAAEVGLTLELREMDPETYRK